MAQLPVGQCRHTDHQHHHRWREDHSERADDAEALAEHIAHFPPAADGSLFTTATGMLYRQDHYSARIFKPAVLASQLPGSTSSHDLRHHYTSLLLAAGESVITVAERLGDTPAMVLKVYGHVLPDSEDRTRKAIDAAWDDGHLTATAHG